MKAKVFIKYGKQEHLQQIVDGSIRFAPSQKYVLMEKELHNKGQGDLLDGKMKIKAENVRLHHPETNELLWVLPKCEFVVSIQDVNNMPVFCLSEYDESDVIAEEGGKFINVHKDKIDGIKNDFKDATHALVIFEPEKFIDDVLKVDGHNVVSDSIRYYDYNHNTIQMYSFLANGTEEYEKGVEMSVTYDNRYRHLLCKDNDFAIQQEYRFIVLDQLIDEPVFYPFHFSSAYIIVPIDELYGRIPFPAITEGHNA